MDRISYNKFYSLRRNLEECKAIIFDLRGYPNSNHKILNHLLSVEDSSSSWLRIPQINYPFQDKLESYDSDGWKLMPIKPYFGGKKIVFLTDNRAISYSESVLSFVKHYKIGTIIGENTAGTNGNQNPFSLPGGIIISWTGMEVLNHDNSKFHGVGIRPDVYVSRTIKGVKAGKDEILDYSIDYLQQRLHK